jgi:hypothetical protein
MRFWPVEDRMHFDQLKRREFITLLGGAASHGRSSGAAAGERAGLANSEPAGQARRRVEMHFAHVLGVVQTEAGQ